LKAAQLIPGALELYGAESSILEVVRILTYKSIFPFLRTMLMMVETMMIMVMVIPRLVIVMVILSLVKMEVIPVMVMVKILVEVPRLW